MYIEWDKDDPQSFVLEFEFDADNEFLVTNKLRKKFTFVSKVLPVSESEAAASNGNAEKPKKIEKYISEPVILKWKKHKNLTKSKTGQTNSFFNWFKFTGEGPGDYSGGETVALTLAEVIFPHAIKLFIDGMNDEMDDQDLDDEYDLDSDENASDDDEEATHEDMPPRKKIKADK